MTGRNEVNMNLYGIYKRNTIDNVPEMNASLDDTRDYCHRRDLHYVTYSNAFTTSSFSFLTPHAKTQD